MKNFQYAFVIVLIGAWVLPACKDKREREMGEGASARVNKYRVMELEPQNVTLKNEYPATIEGQQNVEIRPKIDGYIEKIFVDEGATVKKDQRLFEINAPQYEQEVRTAKANIEIALSEVNTAQMEVNRIRPLVKKGIISHYELEAAEFDLQSKKATLAQARANLANAQTNLGYTMITSPVDGVVGTIPYKIGSLVSSNIDPPLTTVSNIQIIYAYFSINEKQVLEFAERNAGTTTEDLLASVPPVSLVLSDGSMFPHKGRVDATGGSIDRATGALRVRASFQNPERLVRSGSTGTVQIPVNVDSAILVPQASVYEIQGKRFVYLVGNRNTVTSREISIRESGSGKFFVVENGLRPGDVLVLEGIVSLREGMTIQPIPVNSDSVYQTLSNL